MSHDGTSGTSGACGTGAGAGSLCSSGSGGWTGSVSDIFSMRAARFALGVVARCGEFNNEGAVVT